jgi:hypothetical protein
MDLLVFYGISVETSCVFIKNNVELGDFILDLCYLKESCPTISMDL